MLPNRLKNVGFLRRATTGIPQQVCMQPVVSGNGISIYTVARLGTT